MQFIAQLLLEGNRLLVIFMCQNNPGMCDEWDANLGGTKALVVSTEALRILEPPPQGNTQLGEVSGISLTPLEGEYDAARAGWTGEPREVLGQLGGKPDWIQGDETPTCDGCQQPMTFVAQLEEGHNHQTAANFGGGMAYAFCCSKCAQAKFLWQQ
jgi:hypothetical protein